MKFKNIAASGAIAAGMLTAAGANAAVTYSLSGPSASFVYVTSDFIATDLTVPDSSMTNCIILSGPCKSTAFIINAAAQWAPGKANIAVEANDLTSYYNFFVGGAFLADGVYQENGLQNGETLTVSGSAGPISPSGGVPEPATWALMIGGIGMTGAGLRRRRAVVAA